MCKWGVVTQKLAIGGDIVANIAAAMEIEFGPIDTPKLYGRKDTVLCFFV